VRMIRRKATTMANVKTMREKARNAYMAKLMDMLVEMGEDVGMSASNEFNFPIVHEDGSEDFIVIKVSVPTGSRDGEVYDGYSLRDEYSAKVLEKAKKAREAEAKKAAKIAKDAANRAKLAASKAAHNA